MVLSRDSTGEETVDAKLPGRSPQSLPGRFARAFGKTMIAHNIRHPLRCQGYSALFSFRSTAALLDELSRIVRRIGTKSVDYPLQEPTGPDAVAFGCILPAHR